MDAMMSKLNCHVSKVISTKKWIETEELLHYRKTGETPGEGGVSPLEDSKFKPYLFEEDCIQIRHGTSMEQFYDMLEKAFESRPGMKYVYCDKKTLDDFAINLLGTYDTETDQWQSPHGVVQFVINLTTDQTICPRCKTRKIVPGFKYCPDCAENDADVCG